MSIPLNLDAVIIGGGVSGLWTLARLRQQGYQAILLEKNALGFGQTRHAQGIIHGGTKYALAGTATDSSEAIAAMPGLWRACLNGDGEVDLSHVTILSEHQYMWSTSTLASRVSGFFASKLMRGRTESVSRAERPAAFGGKYFKGSVYRLDEPVLDTATIIHALAAPHADAIWAMPSDCRIDVTEAGATLVMDDGAGQTQTIHCKRVVLAAGQGNEALLQQIGRRAPEMQIRPLQMAMVRGPLPGPLFAHCIDGSKTRVTITSHRDQHGELVWYLGGQLSEDGASMSAADLLRHAKTEMQQLFPDIDWSQAQWGTLAIDRAEIRQPGGARPPGAYVQGEAGVITAWPTKMAFAPLVAAGVLDELKQAGITPSEATPLPAHSHPGYALLPWQEDEKWN